MMLVAHGFLCIVFIVLFFLSLRNRIYALVPVALTINLDLFGRIGDTQFTWQHLSGVFAMFFWLLYSAKDKEALKETGVIKWYATFLVYVLINYGVVSIFTDLDPVFEFLFPTAWVNYLFFMALIPFFIKTKKDLIFFLTITVGAFIFINSIGILQSITGLSFLPYETKGFQDKLNHVQRTTSVFYDPNRYAMILVMMVPLSILVFGLKSKVKLLGMSVLLSSLYLVLMSLSRAGYFALACVIAGSLMFSNKQKKVLIIVLILLCSYFAIEFLDEALLNRLSYNAASGDLSNAQRFSAWEAGLKAFSEYPLLGVGLGNFYNNYSRFGNSDPNVIENLPLSILAETGIIGSVIFFAMIFVQCRKLIYSWQANGDPLYKYVFLSIIAFLGFSLFHNYPQQSLFWILMVIPDLQLKDDDL